MKSMCVELRFGETALGPLHAGLCADPDLDREVVLGGQSVGGVESVSSFVYGDPAAYEALLVDRESVVEYDITPAEGGFFLYLRRRLGPEGVSMVDSLARETVVVVPPVELRSDRTMLVTVVGHPADFRGVVETIPEGVSLDVRRVGDGVTRYDAALSDRQREALRVARDIGYFEVPRRNGVEAVASELDCAVSTASELLRRGQARAVGLVLDGRF